ncbi:AEC family transporter [Moraxella pluranimalium]|nr:AEC family transporter [Moraxella pluranimalium]
MMTLIINSLIPLVLCIALGAILHWYRFVPDTVWQGIDKLNYYVLFPSLLFLSISQAQVVLSEFGSVMTAVAIVLMLATIAMTVANRLGVLYENIGVYTQSAIRFNTYIGLALVASLFGNDGLTLYSLIIALFIPVINVISVLSLTAHQELSPKRLIHNLMTNPLIVACILAIMVNLSPLSMPTAINELMRLLGTASLPLGLICIGAGLQFAGLLGRGLPLVMAHTLIRLLLMPALAFLVCGMMGITGIGRQVVVLFFALPTAPTAYVLTKVLGGNHALMAQIISLQTVLAMVTLPTVLWWLMA